MKPLLLLAVLVPLSACGVKPANLHPPEGADPQSYPKTYPSAK